MVDDDMPHGEADRADEKAVVGKGCFAAHAHTGLVQKVDDADRVPQTGAAALGPRDADQCLIEAASDRTGPGTRSTYAPLSRPVLLPEAGRLELDRMVVQLRSGETQITLGKKSLAWRCSMACK